MKWSGVASLLRGINSGDIFTMSIASRTLSFPLLLLVGIASTPIRADEEAKPKGGPPEFKYLKYRPIGPAAGGRVSRACGVPSDPLTYYAATAAGGVWKSSDGGVHWKPIFDEQAASSI